MWKILHHPRDGLAGEYAKGMQHFGCGEALFQPIAGGNICPPCIGYRDINGAWNPVADIAWRDEHGKRRNAKSGDKEVESDGFVPLARAPVKMEELGIEWRPRTSNGVRQWNVDVQGQTPSGAGPVGADAHIKYKSNTKFGAVLIVAKPVTLTTYNDETLFRSWIADNRARLSALHGAEIRRYGLLLVTTTYKAPRASINAWEDKDKEALVSGKMKASMLGEDGITLDYTDRLNDKDWSHYQENEKKKDGVVVFFDGFEVPAWDWWWEALKMSLGTSARSASGSSENGGSRAQQSLVRGQSLRQGMSTRESLMGEKKRSWDEKPTKMYPFGTESPSQATRTSLLSADSPPQSGVGSPLSVQSPAGSRRASPTPRGVRWRTTLTPPVPKHSQQPYHESLSKEDNEPLLTGIPPNGREDRLSSASTATPHSDAIHGSLRYSGGAAMSHTDSKSRDAKSHVKDVDSRHSTYADFQDHAASNGDAWYSNYSAPDPGSQELGYSKSRLGDSKRASGFDTTPTMTAQRHSLRRKTSSPSLRKPS